MKKNKKTENSTTRRKKKGNPNPGATTTLPKESANPNNPPTESPDAVSLADYIIDLRRKLNWQLFRKCIEKKFLSEEMDILED